MRRRRPTSRRPAGSESLLPYYQRLFHCSPPYVLPPHSVAGQRKQTRASTARLMHSRPLRCFCIEGNQKVHNGLCETKGAFCVTLPRATARGLTASSCSTLHATAAGEAPVVKCESPNGNEFRLGLSALLCLFCFMPCR